jgi:hypothetical protein
MTAPDTVADCHHVRVVGGRVRQQGSKISHLNERSGHGEIQRKQHQKDG